MTYPWYLEIMEAEPQLEQRDFINNCPIVIPPASYREGQDTGIDVVEADVIILSQSCDLVHGKIENVLVCPVGALTEWFKNAEPSIESKRAKQKTAKNLSSGFLHAYHLLNKEEGIFDDYIVVDFRNVYGINFNLLQEIVRQTRTRTRLLSPYREHLSQAFARYFMRVGLPQDINIKL